MGLIWFMCLIWSYMILPTLIGTYRTNMYIYTSKIVLNWWILWYMLHAQKFTTNQNGFSLNIIPTMHPKNYVILCSRVCNQVQHIYNMNIEKHKGVFNYIFRVYVTFVLFGLKGCITIVCWQLQHTYILILKFSCQQGEYVWKFNIFPS
jgi:hypothetical protein